MAKTDIKWFPELQTCIQDLDWVQIGLTSSAFLLANIQE
jgi:hypothetical protein